MRKFLLSTLFVVLPAAVAFAQSAEDTAKARMAYFELLGFEMHGLAAMAKGEVDYDADVAMAHAKDLKALTGYTISDLFAPGTSNADLPGKTRAQPAIWENMDSFQEKGKALFVAVDELNAAAGNGLDALRPAVGKLGAACKGCHDDFRAKDF
ncbi:cytochrome c556 [Rhodobium orientis]|uniref:Cytochrome C n=1 Tax=Rhodobium orientis TaxID=34017 RepID=A0A327JLN4_9HYPH|nr:cytochrome c [Rhodobium orientis]MBB4305005.1 cytochrome c556 [Rhodobium orientis]MBK5948787.1 cytochrome C [Rhodobium orientis]RAI26476.1 cytochrome C [Rhodobium orientis]